MTPDPAAWIAGQPASLDAAVARAGLLLGASRNAVIAGLDTDIAAIEVAVTLAERIGAVLDHLHAEAGLPELEAIRRDGWIGTTPLQARARADLIVLVGPGIAHVWPEFAQRLALTTPPPLAPDRTRRVVLVGADAATAAQVRADATVEATAADLPATLGLLRALAAGRRVRAGHPQQAAVEAVLPLLAEARYGVVAWASGLPVLAVECLLGLVDELNANTRFAGLPLGAGAGNMQGATQAVAWRTGFPLRTAFARGYAEHDPWRFCARRMVGSGEADAALWIGASPPDWSRLVPSVALMPAGASWPTPPEVAITVGQAGIDHDSVLHHPDLGTLAAFCAARPSATPRDEHGSAQHPGGTDVLTLLAGGRVIDPAHQTDAVGDLWIEDGAIVAAPQRAPDTRHDVAGCVVMAGGIDIHSHIAGVNVNTARLLLPELRQDGALACAPVGAVIGSLYAAMGFTTVVEPAISPFQAVQAQAELAAIPCIDRAILGVMGNDDAVLELLRDRAGASAIADTVARTLTGARALGLKVINPGAAAAFKSNVRSFGLDDAVPGYDVTSRTIILAMQDAAVALGLPHPVHLHCSNLGLAGNVETALATIAAAGDRRLHLAHLQFYAYGTDGPRGFSSAAPRLIEALDAHPHLTADVGQVMFGQTVTVSSDVLRQFSARGQGHPRKAAIMDGEGNGGGVIPYRYRRGNFYNAVQWAAGLELFLLNRDPWRLFFTTDHPNGAPFTAYPDLLALLMSRDLRDRWIATLPKAAMEVSTLPSIGREYSLAEIATMTRAAPARLLGLPDRGHLAPGARADIAVYREQPDRAAMFRDAALVFKDGRLVARDGHADRGVFGRILAAAPGYDRAIDRVLAARSERLFGVGHDAFDVPDLAPFEMVACA